MESATIKMVFLVPDDDGLLVRFAVSGAFVAELFFRALRHDAYNRGGGSVGAMSGVFAGIQAVRNLRLQVPRQSLLRRREVE